MTPLISPSWLAARLQDASQKNSSLDDLGIVLLDASWFLPDAGRDAAAEFLAAHIPGARFLDLGTLVDPAQPGLSMAPTAPQFAERLSVLGVTDDSHVILYDNSPLHSAARAWWLFRLFGVDRVAILDGGLSLWQAEGHDVTSALAPLAAPVTPPDLRYDPRLIADKPAVAAAAASGSTQISDARGPARFAGTEPEPREGVAPGHIPGARNLPYATLFDGEGRYLDPDRLRGAFARAGVDPAAPIIATCGSGVTAACIAVAAAVIGHPQVAVYDGSWTEWGADPETPKATGAEP